MLAWDQKIALSRCRHGFRFSGWVTIFFAKWKSFSIVRQGESCSRLSSVRSIAPCRSWTCFPHNASGGHIEGNLHFVALKATPRPRPHANVPREAQHRCRSKDLWIMLHISSCRRGLTLFGGYVAYRLLVDIRAASPWMRRPIDTWVVVNEWRRSAITLNFLN